MFSAYVGINVVIILPRSFTRTARIVVRLHVIYVYTFDVCVTLIYDPFVLQTERSFQDTKARWTTQSNNTRVRADNKRERTRRSCRSTLYLYNVRALVIIFDDETRRDETRRERKKRYTNTTFQKKKVFQSPRAHVSRAHIPPPAGRFASAAHRVSDSSRKMLCVQKNITRFSVSQTAVAYDV